MKQIFQDKDGNLSSKRVFGAIVIGLACIYTAIGIGDPELVKVMFGGGFLAVGITAFEKKTL